MTTRAMDAASMVANLEELPPFPPVLTEVLTMLEDRDTTATDLAHLIEKDQGLASKLLRLTNSAFFGFPRRIGNVTTAVVLLGFNNVKHLVTGISFLDYFRRGKSGVINAEELWRHAYSCAVCARALAVKTHLEDFETTFTLGLLHDIGKLVMAWSQRDRIPEGFDFLLESGVNGLLMERQVFGTDHTEVGAELAQTWRFPPAFAEVIHMHETPFLSNLSEPADMSQLLVVHLADQIAWPREFGETGDLPTVPFLATVVERLGVSVTELVRIAGDSATRSRNVLEALETPGTD